MPAARLAVALANERDFPLTELYRRPLLEFELAMDLMRDWRLDRYCAARFRLFDVVLNDVLHEETHSQGDVANPLEGVSRRRLDSY